MQLDTLDGLKYKTPTKIYVTKNKCNDEILKSMHYWHILWNFN